jgi:apolipoprotein N-acyltransferase
MQQQPSTKPSWALAGAIFMLLAFIGVGYDMYRLDQAAQLWGHRPLYLFLGFWLAYLLLREYFAKTEQHSRYRWNAVFAGVLLSVGFAPGIMLPALFIGFVPLLWIEDQCRHEPKAGRKVFRYAFTTFFTWNILTTYWVSNSLLLAGVFAILANSFLMSLPFVLFHYGRKKLGDVQGYILFIALWMSWEYLHLRWDASWPWLTLGNGLANWPSLIQWYSIAGHTGGSFWILAVNLLIFRQWQKTGYSNWKGWAFWYKPLALAGIPMLISLAMYFSWKPSEQQINIVAIQPNFEPHYVKWRNSKSLTNYVPPFEQVNRIMAQIEANVDSKTDYVVMPETSIVGVEASELLVNTDILRVKQLVDKYPGLTLVSGIDAHRILPENEPSGPYTIDYTRAGGMKLRYEDHNSALQLSAGSNDIPYYLKSRFVPGPEIFPFRKIFVFLKPLIEQLGGTPAGLTPQPEREVFSRADGLKVAPVICYESVYGEYLTEYVRNGANIIMVVTNDGWWDDTPGYIQHAQFASLRAIENRRPVVRAANSGTSCFVNSRGDISQASNYNEAAVVKGTVNPENGLTFYAKHGDYLSRMCILIAGVFMLFAITPIRRK